MTHLTPRHGAFAVGAAALLAVGTIVVGTSSAKQERTARVSETTVSVIEHAITDTENPGVLGADVKGNILTFNNPVFDPANTVKVGHDEGFCTRVQPGDHIWECLWTTFLADGQITVQGPYYDNRNSVLSITGGTGAYADSRGQMLLNSLENGAEYDFIFQLS